MPRALKGQRIGVGTKTIDGGTNFTGRLIRIEERIDNRLLCSLQCAVQYP